MSKSQRVEGRESLHTAGDQTGYLRSATVYHRVKVKVNVKFTLEQATKAQSGSRGTAVPFL